MGRARFATWFVGVAALAMAAGCAPYRPRLSFAVEQRILRETSLDDTPEGEARVGDGVVRLVRFHRGGSGACSGAVIGPRHVLTAQHCVVALDGFGELTKTMLRAGDLHVELGGDYLPWGRIGIREIHACEGYAGDLEHDIAVIVLSKPVPRDLPIFDLTYDLPTEAAIFELSGFGSAAPSRRAPNLGSILLTHRHVHQGPVLRANDERLAVRVPAVPGDSGGPILDAATGRIAAVVSRGRAKEDWSGIGRESIPLADGPRLMNCKKTIATALAR